MNDSTKIAIQIGTVLALTFTWTALVLVSAATLAVKDATAPHRPVPPKLRMIAGGKQ